MGLGFSIFEYNGHITIGVLADDALLDKQEVSSSLPAAVPVSLQGLGKYI